MLPIAQITIKRFAAIEELIFQPGGVTEIRGKNGAGKSTVINAIIAGLKGCPGKYVRDGEAEAQVLIELNEGEGGTTVNRRIKREGKQPPPLIKPFGAPAIGSPAAWLAERVDTMINPIDFITCEPEKRLRLFVEAMPVQVSAAELAEACAGTIDQASLDTAAKEHALIAIDTIRARLTEARRDANVGGKAKRSSIAQLQKSLPVADEEDSDWGVVESNLAGQVGALDERLAAGIRAAEAAKATEIREAAAELVSAGKVIDADIERRIAELRVEQGQRKLTATQACDKRKSNAGQLCADQKDALQAAEATERNGLAASLATATAKREEAGRVANTREIITGLEEEAGDLEGNWKRYNEAMSQLDKLGAGLLSKMPIEGIEARGGNLFRGGIPFELLNTAQCMDIAMELSELRAGKIGLVCVDGIERLDPYNQAAWYERAANSGLHFFFTRVTGEQTLTIENYVPEAAA